MRCGNSLEHMTNRTEKYSQHIIEIISRSRWVRSDVALHFSLNKRPPHLHFDLEVSWTLEVNVRGQGCVTSIFLIMLKPV
jgi:hypothetical protein